MHRSRNIPAYQQLGLLLLCLQMTACNPIELPDYWICSGQSRQELRSPSGRLLGTYTGRHQVLLERYKNSVFQFNAPALFGLYTICANTAAQLRFRSERCTEDDGSSTYREGVLTLTDGKLSFSDRRALPDGVAIVHAEYVCKPLGSSYSFKDLEDRLNAD